MPDFFPMNGAKNDTPQSRMRLDQPTSHLHRKMDLERGRRLKQDVARFGSRHAVASCQLEK